MRYGQGVSDLINLNDPVARDVMLVGGKAASLALLSQRGLPVQPGVIVPVLAFDRFLERKEFRGLSDEKLAEAILESELNAELAGRLRTAAARLGPRLVVRSSAVAEDGEQSS